MYILALLLPPVAVMMCGKPFQALMNLFLMLFFYIPSIVHALLVVHEYKSDKRINK